MENFDQQNNAREPLPVFENPAQPPVYTQPIYEQPVYQPQQANIPQLEALVNSAFGKGLASAIMCSFPVASIIAIVMGSQAQNLALEAEAMAAHYGISAGGKKTAAKILGKVGKIAGIAYTAFWAFYLLYFIFIFAMIFSEH